VLGVPLGEIALLVVAVMVAGVATGILAGLFGIGGGAIIVPVLYEIFRILGVPEEVRMQLCVGTSMAIIIPTTIRSYIAHRAKNMVLNDVMRAWAVPAVLGVRGHEYHVPDERRDGRLCLEAIDEWHADIEEDRVISLVGGLEQRVFAIAVPSAVFNDRRRVSDGGQDAGSRRAGRGAGAGSRSRSPTSSSRSRSWSCRPGSPGTWRRSSGPSGC